MQFYPKNPLQKVLGQYLTFKTFSERKLEKKSFSNFWTSPGLVHRFWHGLVQIRPDIFQDKSQKIILKKDF